MKHFLNLFLLVISILSGIFICEVCLSSLNITPYIAPVDCGIFQITYNPLIKCTYKPFLKNYSDGKSWLDLSTNSEGFRDREFTKYKPFSNKRIIVLGDSIAAGWDISPSRYLFSNILEGYLNRSNPGHYEVYNMAISGDNTLQEAGILLDYGIKYRPDIVLITYCLNDDTIGIDESIYQDLLNKEDKKKKAFLNEMREAVLSGNFKNKLYSFKLYRLFKYYFLTKIDHGKGNKNVFSDIDVVDEGFKKIYLARQKYGFRVIVAIVPWFDKPLDAYAYLNNHEYCKTRAARYSFEVIDLLPYFKSCFKGRKKEIYALDPCHPNKLGHRYIAKVLSYYLKKGINE